MTEAYPVWEAYEAGFCAGLTGEDPRACPFDTMTAEHKSWHEGQRRGAVFRRFQGCEDKR